MAAATALATLKMRRVDDDGAVDITIDHARSLGSGNEGTNYRGHAAMGHAALAVKVCRAPATQGALFARELDAHKRLTLSMHVQERNGFIHQVPAAERAHIIPLLAYRAETSTNGAELDLASPLVEHGVRGSHL